MTTRMLIDARHREETRVAVLKGNRIEEFDFESADHKQIKGNIYLAKVTRVEPSLQAAFIDFGGNRHGFLAFSEIHPDYYQIPKQDRDALLAEEAAHAEEEAALRAADDEFDDDGGEAQDGDYADDGEGNGGVTEVDTDETEQVATIEDGHVENGFDHAEEEEAEAAEQNDDEAADDGGERRPRGRRRQGRGQSKEADELRAKRMALRRRYKIQDVIHRRQVLLVQVVKEERGNKGAALTTYLSLAGRYCVLMPNSSHGGGISRKISSGTDRKRLKSIIGELGLPKSMGCIVRTAGLSRTKTEIKRDFDYLARLWDEIRETTLKSSAPTLIHSDSDLIKRAIRDIYNKDIEDVVVEGEAGYRAAKDFMKLLMPSHSRRVKQYADPVPLFQRYGAEDQLTAMYDPVVQLKSGGYIVINPTEALVSIDINSGRSTKEHGIEATALSTNLEAAREIARQLRLRDMAGLVVIDFIDMEYGQNVRKVEKAMKDALKNDRARIQLGRISSFGLMEMSRQRLRTGVLEATTRSCPHCDGSGLVRTAGSAGLSALRMIEDEAAKGRGSVITLFASQEATIYVLNAKRADLAEIEARYGVRVEVVPEGEEEGAKMRVASSGPRPEFVPKFEPIAFEDDEDDDLPPEDDEAEDEAEESDERAERGESEGEGRRKRRKRRRGRGRDREEGDSAERSDESEAGDEHSESDEDDQVGSADGTLPPEEGEAPRKRRRRGRRRRGGSDREGTAGEFELDSQGSEATSDQEASEEQAEHSEAAEAPAAPAEPVDEAPAKPPRRRRKTAELVEAPALELQSATGEPSAAEETAPTKPARRRRATAAGADDTATEANGDAAAEEKPKRARRKKADTAAPAEPASEAPVEEAVVVEEQQPAAEPVATSAANDAEEGETSGSSRRGWWQRTFGS